MYMDTDDDKNFEDDEDGHERDRGTTVNDYRESLVPF
jgi:hypothetical protein